MDFDAPLYCDQCGVTRFDEHFPAGWDGPICPLCVADRCARCNGAGWVEACRADGEDCAPMSCPVCHGDVPEDDTNPRERGDDDGVEYADPREVY